MACFKLCFVSETRFGFRIKVYSLCQCRVCRELLNVCCGSTASDTHVKFFFLCLLASIKCLSFVNNNPQNVRTIGLQCDNSIRRKLTYAKYPRNRIWWYYTTLYIYASGSNDRGHIIFVLSVFLSVWLSVVNFNIRYNFWTVRGRDFIFGMHISLMMPFQMTPRSMTLWPWLWHLLLK